MSGKAAAERSRAAAASLREGGDAHDFAEKTGHSVGGLKVTLHRLRNALLGCIQRQLGTQEGTMNRQERNQLIDALIEGDISEADFLRLEAEFSVDPAARQEYYDRLALRRRWKPRRVRHRTSGRKIVAMPAPARRWIPAFAAMAAMFIALAAVAASFCKTSAVGDRRRRRRWSRRPAALRCSPVRPMRSGRTRRRSPMARCFPRVRCISHRASHRLSCSAA